MPSASLSSRCWRLLGCGDFRCSIRQPLANDALQRFDRAGVIAVAEPNAMAVPKIELGKIAVQMLFAAMVIDALNAAVECGGECLDRGVGGGRGTGIQHSPGRRRRWALTIDHFGEGVPPASLHREAIVRVMLRHALPGRARA
jgi:hypothetical protein